MGLLFIILTVLFLYSAISMLLFQFMISLYLSSSSSLKSRDLPDLNFRGDFLLLHISLVTLLRSSQSVEEAPRPSKAAPTHRRSQSLDLALIVHCPVENVSAP